MNFLSMNRTMYIHINIAMLCHINPISLKIVQSHKLLVTYMHTSVVLVYTIPFYTKAMLLVYGSIKLYLWLTSYHSGQINTLLHYQFYFNHIIKFPKISHISYSSFYFNVIILNLTKLKIVYFYLHSYFYVCHHFHVV